MIVWVFELSSISGLAQRTVYKGDGKRLGHAGAGHLELEEHTAIEGRIVALHR